MTTEQQGLPNDFGIDPGDALERIHSMMWRRRISQVEIAQVIGIGQSTFSKKLRGEVPMTLVEFCLIADFLEVAASDLLVRARRYSKPQPSDWEPDSHRGGHVAGAVTLRLVKPALTPDERTPAPRAGHLRSVS